MNSGQFARRKAALDAAKAGAVHEVEKLDWWEMRAYMIPDTMISGALTGSVLNAWKRTLYTITSTRVRLICILHLGGRAGVIPGAATTSVMCTLLQLAYNELGVLRLKFISKKMQAAREEDVQKRLVESPASQTVVNPEPLVLTAPPKPIAERIFGWFGFQRVSDDDFLERLKLEREVHLRRIAELEKDQEDRKTSD